MPTTKIYTLSLHDALPISWPLGKEYLPTWWPSEGRMSGKRCKASPGATLERPCSAFRTFCPRSDRKSTRLNSSHANISYAVFCLKKKKSVMILLSNYDTQL